MASRHTREHTASASGGEAAPPADPPVVDTKRRDAGEGLAVPPKHRMARAGGWEAVGVRGTQTTQERVSCGKQSAFLPRASGREQRTFNVQESKQSIVTVRPQARSYPRPARPRVTSPSYQSPSRLPRSPGLSAGSASTSSCSPSSSGMPRPSCGIRGCSLGPIVPGQH